MNTRLIFIPAFIGLLMLAGCSSIKVVADQDPTVDWSHFKTYEYFGWAEDSDKILTRFDRERIEKAFGQEFASRGLEYVEEGGDLVVSLFIVVEDMKGSTATTTTSGSTYGYSGRYYGQGPGYGWGSGYSTTTVEEYNFQEGTLVCDVFDANKKELIWEGIGTGTVNEDPSKRDKTIPRSVAAIMKKFPVQTAE